MKVELDSRYTFSVDNGAYFCNDYIGTGCNGAYTRLIAMIHRAKFMLVIEGFHEILENKNHDISLHINPISYTFAVRYGCHINEFETLEQAGKDFDICLIHAQGGL